MDFLDPKKQRQHTILLYSGYILIGIAILISTVVLVYQANGFGVNSKGQVVQNGLVFFSSQPSPATIYLNNQRNSSQTNNRLSLSAGQYRVRLTRTDYRDWRRTVSVQGGDVQHFDYPFLFPTKLTPKALTANTTNPGIATQSLDRRWLIVQASPNSPTFTLFDLKNPNQVAPTTLTLPAATITATGTQSWQVIGWADDNTHLLLQHNYTGGSEYIELDRTDAAKTVNVTTTLTTGAATINFIDNKYDQFYLFDSKAATLSSVSLGNRTATKVASGVLSYKSYKNDTVLYATADGAPTGKADINMLSGGQTYLLRQVTASSSYLLDMASYSGTPYVVIGAENEAYIYKDPLAQLRSNTGKIPTAIRAFALPGISYIGFSPNAQFIVNESANQFAVYDIYAHRAYRYSVKSSLDVPQLHASWMDGDRLSYVSGGKLIVIDYDNANAQSLITADANYLPFFSDDYHYLYTLTSNGSVLQLTQTPLLTPADL